MAEKADAEREQEERRDAPEKKRPTPTPGFIADICMGVRQPKMQPKLVHGRDAIVRRF